MSSQPQLKSCVIYPKPNANSRARLFCFPYAGGTAAIFRTWASYLPAEVEVCAIQHPGRGRRIAERLNEDIEEMMNSSYDELKPFLNKPFAFFGHSMGALVSCRAAFLFICMIISLAMPNAAYNIHRCGLSLQLF